MIDPLATYDALGRKAPKRLFGFLEVCRAVPGFLGQFPGRVPGDRWIPDADGSRAIFDCVCGEVVEANFNQIEDCPGACGRTFAYVGREVCVRREPEDETAVAT